MEGVHSNRIKQLILLSAIVCMFLIVMPVSAEDYNVKCGENKTFTEFNIHFSEIIRDPSLPLPDLCENYSENNIARISLTAAPNQNGFADAIVGVKFTKDLNGKSLDQAKNTPVRVIVKYSYKLQADWVEGYGSANADYFRSLNKSSLHIGTYHGDGQGTLADNVREVYDINWSDLDLEYRFNIECQAGAIKESPGSAFSKAKVVIDSISIEFPPPVADFDIQPFVDPRATRNPWAPNGPVPMIGGLIEFNASKSTGDIVEYQWDFGDGETLTRVVGQGDEGFGWGIAHHIYQSENTFKVTLRVKDSSGRISDPKVKYYKIPKLKPGDIIFCDTLGWEGIPGFFSHCGLYIGNGKIVEAVNLPGHGIVPGNRVAISSINTWNFNTETCVAVFRVRTTPKIKSRAVKWAVHAAHHDPPYTYDMNFLGRQQRGNSYYCSELVWAAYSLASGGTYRCGMTGCRDTRLGSVNLGRMGLGFLGGIKPDDIANDGAHVRYIASHWEQEPSH